MIPEGNGNNMIDLGNGRYQIRNKKTGEVREVQEAELGNYGLKAPSKPKEKMSLKGLGSNLMSNIKDTGKGLWQTFGDLMMGGHPLGGLLDPQGAQESRKRTLQTAVNIPGAILSSAGEFISNPVDYAYKNPLDIALSIIPALKGAKAVTKGAVKAGTKVAKVTGKTAQTVGDLRKVKQLGEQIGSKVESQTFKNASKLITERFGTARDPATKLYDDLVSAGGETEAKQIIGKEIVNLQGKVNMKTGELSASDVLKKRIGTGNQAAYYKKQGLTTEQKIMQRLNHEYSSMLHDLDKGLIPLDERFSRVKKLSDKVQGATQYLPRAVSYYLIYRTLNNLMKKFGDIVNPE